MTKFVFTLLSFNVIKFAFIDNTLLSFNVIKLVYR